MSTPSRLEFYTSVAAKVAVVSLLFYVVIMFVVLSTVEPIKCEGSAICSFGLYQASAVAMFVLLPILLGAAALESVHHRFKQAGLYVACIGLYFLFLEFGAELALPILDRFFR